MTKSKKIVIIGAGHVGSHCAYSLAAFSVCNEIVFIDIDEVKANSHALDISDAVSLMSQPVSVRCGDYSDCKDADIVVISAGVQRRAGQTRLDTMTDSILIMKDIIPLLNNSGFDGILITISNPADIIADYLRKGTGIHKNRCIGTGTGLDSARLKRIISDIYAIDQKSITAISMGEHGDSQMIPFSSLTIGGMPISEYDKSASYSEILKATKATGMDIVIGKGATEFGIGTVLADLAKAILNDEKRILPVSAQLDGEYGLFGVSAGVPCVIGKNGIERIIELTLTKDENKQLEESAKVIAHHINLAAKI